MVGEMEQRPTYSHSIMTVGLYHQTAADRDVVAIKGLVGPTGYLMQLTAENARHIGDALLRCADALDAGPPYPDLWQGGVEDETST